ncbi:hypothetical protein C0J52_23738 [Blattella germanica]|nr:hypothetical protein C0J52_23738 [Blattella germanica]
MNPSDETFTPKGRGRGPWKQGLDHKELRRPRNEEKIGCATNSNSLNNVEDPGAGGDVQKTGSTLSANAKEFYPKGYQPPEGQNCNSQFAEVIPSFHLVWHFRRFDALIAPLVDTFRVWMQQEDTEAAVVDVIVDQSITEPNLRYNGARLCSFLNNEFSTAFRSSLLRRCQQEYPQMRTNLFCAPARLCGYIMFMAELFMQLEVVQGHGGRIAILGTGIMESLDLLLTNPVIDNIKCVCNVLKESAGRIPDSEDYDDYSEDGEAWIPDDEMDEEIQAAYEQFLKMGKNSKSSDNKCSN